MSSEDLKTENKFKVFLTESKKYLKLIISLVVTLLLILILIFFFNHRAQKQNVIISEQFNKANILINNKNDLDAKNILIDIVNKKNKFYSPLSLFLIVEEELIKDEQEVIKLFDKVISIKKIDRENLNLIKIKKALFLFQNGNEEEILAILNPIINSESLWRRDAIKLLSEYFLYRGEKLKSDEYKSLLNSVKTK